VSATGHLRRDVLPRPLPPSPCRVAKISPELLEDGFDVGGEAGVPLFYLSRIMGTSLTMIDKTYGHLVRDSDEYVRGLLDGYDRLRISGAVAAKGG
jgi:hypothetical protein